jgi:hypothetical protein
LLQVGADNESREPIDGSAGAPTYATAPPGVAPSSSVAVLPVNLESSADAPSGDGDASARPGFTPMLISAMLFALVHLNYGPSAGPLFVFGLTLGYLYRQTHRILPCVICHMSLNAVTMTLVTINAVKS